MRIVDEKGQPIGGRPSYGETFRDMCTTLLRATLTRELSQMAEERARRVRDVAREIAPDDVPAGTLTIRKPANYGGR